MAVTYEPIATTTLGSGANTVTFSSIPSTYTDIRAIIVASNSVGSNNIRMQFNSDTGTNYSYTNISGDGSAAGSNRATSLGYILVGSDTTNPSLTTLDIFSYASSTNKTCLSTLSNDQNGSGTALAQVSLWRSTSAIDTITFYHVTDNWDIGSTFTLYGIKAA